MARHTLYAYVEGSDLDQVAADVEARVERFISNTAWRRVKPRVVNHRRTDDFSLRPGDLPDWELGLNIDLPDPPEEPEGWFDDIAKIAEFFAELHGVTGRDFVIGIADNAQGFAEDLFFINNVTPDIGLLRRTIGVA